ncbi:MAG: diacylglycerol kinase family protein [Caldilineaceae bacterium SB0661_bin_32]|uniref:Diacylglycerol kinase family protein n=1 Tax=Caldilineaceae bacterium SB0661_bin_32 TaxID=2605255 RepID=A0A6B1DBR8_9CHLR|nr:diacylglycerol kinase family protein [Caldilineaceae bacterium SB0661_bin_32]
MKPPARARSFWQSLAFAIAGMNHALKSQRNLRIHFTVAAAVVIAGLVLRISRTEWAVVVTLIALVIGLELLNTAIEALVDLASPVPHPLAKVAKDTAAGAILVAAVGSAIVGLLVFLPRCWQLFF